MAVPRKRKSKSRRGQQRSHDSLTSTNLSSCSNCGAPKLPHRICGEKECGWYGGRVVVAPTA
jgi:large subunit ribosomal protein L32